MDKLFDSFTDPIPPLRYDIQQVPVHQDDENLIYFHDLLGYSTDDFALPLESNTILSLIDGTRSIEDILEFSTERIQKEDLLEYIQFLDKQAILNSPHFKAHSESVEQNYEESTIHNPTTAGIAYPEDPAGLTAFLDEAFSSNEQSVPLTSAKALYAPHIDPRIGIKSYVKAFSSIRELKPTRVVILGTSHYAGLYGSLYQETPFIISDKTFRMPNGDVKSDSDSINTLKSISHAELDSASVEASEYGISFKDRGHRIEHSIELHLLFLNHIWQHEFKILPILVGGLDELLYSDKSFREQQVDKFAELLRSEVDDENTFFLISGDLAHFGKKFGDPEPASAYFEDVKTHDTRFLDISASGNTKDIVQLMKEDFDPYRICGFPPLLTFLKSYDQLQGTVLSRELWDEKEQESAVSFGSILYK